MQTKTFSVKGGTLVLQDGDIELLSENDIMLGINMVLATTNEQLSEKWNLHLLPSTLIRKQKTDEELAEEYINKKLKTMGNAHLFDQYECQETFLDGRKSVGGEFHLTREDLELLIGRARLMRSGIEDDEPMFDKDYLISSLTPPIYPHKITVEHDGEKYLWETLKAEY